MFASGIRTLDIEAYAGIFQAKCAMRAHNFLSHSYRMTSRACPGWPIDDLTTYAALLAL